MKLNQVLVVYKQVSASLRGRKGPNALHLATLNELYEFLKEMGISFEMKSIRQLKNAGGVDLVITVGGDGTVLAASHYTNKSPILGIKSFGRHSVGYFCAATRQTMKKFIKEIISNMRRPINLHRLQTVINGQKVAELALNDVLFASAIPASTSKYKLIVGRRAEEQKSSGVWISTAAGTTAAVRAAGGRVLPLVSDKIEYLVREPYYTAEQYCLTNEVLSPNASIKVISMMPQGTVFIDGGSTQYPAPEGSVITIKGAGKPLKVYWR